MAKTIKIYDTDKFLEIIDGLALLKETNVLTSKISESVTNFTSNSILKCSCCKVDIESVHRQREHYKSDWHRYNLKRHLKCLEPVSETDYADVDDTRTTSESESMSDDDDDEEENECCCSTVHAHLTRSSKILFGNTRGQIISMYRCLLHEKKDVIENEDDCMILARTYAVPCNASRLLWTIIMLSGGHFACAVFDGGRALLHKTFHSYTVRAKQGGAQAAHDGSAGGAHHPKSSGASLRRYNQKSFTQHIGVLLNNSIWSTYITQSSLVFYQAAGPFNQAILFGGKNPIFNKADRRLRTIPFSTYRPNFTEVQRVYNILATIQIFSNVNATKNQKEKNYNDFEKSDKNLRINLIPDDNDDAKNNITLEYENKKAMNEFSLDVEKENRIETLLSKLNVNSSSGSQEQKSEEMKDEEKEKEKEKDEAIGQVDNDIVKSNLYIACSSGNVEWLTQIVFDNDGGKRSLALALAGPLDGNGNSALHVAAVNGRVDAVRWLLENGASPCVRNGAHQTPYAATEHGAVRQAFRAFAQHFPNKFNYAQAQIPQHHHHHYHHRKRKQKQRERKEQGDTLLPMVKLVRDDSATRSVDSPLSPLSPLFLLRCSLCGVNITHRIPFEYSENKFCSITCLKTHRTQHSNFIH